MTSTVGSGVGYVVLCVNVGVAAVVARTINVGRIAFSPTLSCSGSWQLIAWLVNPHEGHTINWRAGCGKSARPVRRKGDLLRSFPYLDRVRYCDTVRASVTVQGIDGQARLRCVPQVALM